MKNDKDKIIMQLNDNIKTLNKRIRILIILQALAIVYLIILVVMKKFEATPIFNNMCAIVALYTYYSITVKDSQVLLLALQIINATDSANYEDLDCIDD